MSPDEARRAATIQLGRTESLKEQVRDVKAGAFVDGWIQDVRYALRLLRRGPLFAVFAIGSLALGIGATGAIFSLFDGIALRRLNVPEPDRLVVASWGKPGARFNYSLPYPQFEAISQRSTTLEAVCWLSPFGRVAVTREGRARGGGRRSGERGLLPDAPPRAGARTSARPNGRSPRADGRGADSCLLAAPLRRPGRRDRHDHRAQSRSRSRLSASSRPASPERKSDGPTM